MSFTVLNMEIPVNLKGRVLIDNVAVDRLEIDGLIVWGNGAGSVTIDHGSYIFTGDGEGTVTISNGIGTFIPPKGFVGEVRVCMCGGGGSGAGAYNLAGGGYAGDIFSGNIAITPNVSIPITIGVGGASVISQINGNNGTLTRFGVYKTVKGGLGGRTESLLYEGHGYSRTTCGGTFKDGKDDGAAHGGQAGAFGDGGFGRHFNPAGPGGIGAGGGSTRRTGGGGEITGRGGNGRIVISWGDEI